MTDTPAVRLERIGKSFKVKRREALALDGITASVAHGQVAALVGPNGTGKTTILRIIATLVTPSSGMGFVMGRDIVTERSAVRRLTGVSLGAGRSFYHRLTAGHNLTFFARLLGVPVGAISREVRRLAAELDIERFLRQPARSLSRGVMARLSVARACLGEPLADTSRSRRKLAGRIQQGFR